MNITVIAAGEFPQRIDVDALLHASQVVACCDGALLHYLAWLKRQTLCPSHQVLVVGDGDSLPDSFLENTSDAPANSQFSILNSQFPTSQFSILNSQFPTSQFSILNSQFNYYRVSEQEDNDLTKTVRLTLDLIRPQLKADEELHVDILGATGLREDHSLANISLLGWYREQFPDVQFRMLSDYGTFLPMRGSRTFASHQGQQVSLFSLTPEVPVSVEGLRYPIQNRPLHWWWEGSLNEALSDTFSVHGGLLVVYLCLS